MYNQVVFVGKFIEVKMKKEGEHELILSRKEGINEELFSFKISDETFSHVISKIKDDTILGVFGSLSSKVIGYNRLSEIIVNTIQIVDDGNHPRMQLN